MLTEIGELTDVKRARTSHHVAMVIQLWLEGEDCVSGSVGLEGRDPIPFQGWLGLLAAVSELVSRPRG